MRSSLLQRLHRLYSRFSNAVHRFPLVDSMHLKCNVLDKTTYDKKMYEKMFWICTMMLVGAAKGCDTVGDAKRDHGELVGEVVSELAGSVSEIEFESGLEDRLNAYTDVVSTFPAAVKEFEWR